MKRNLIVILSLLIVSLIVAYFVPESMSSEFQFHDTYYILDFPLNAIFIFLIFSFITLLIWQITGKFENRSRNYLLLFISLINLLILIYEIFYLNLQSQYGGWVVYPPLSALADEQEKLVAKLQTDLLVLKIAVAGIIVVITYVIFKLIKQIRVKSL